MAAGVTKIADVIVPERFADYVQKLTAELSALIQSGAVVESPILTGWLNDGSGSMTLNRPGFNDLDNDAENISTDNEASLSTPFKIASHNQIAIRLNRNQSWSDMDLVGQLISGDPLQAIGDRVAAYWVRREQVLFVSTMTGIFADNDAAPAGDDTHTAGDLTFDISGGGFVDGVTNFNTAGFIDAQQTMGDAQSALTMIMVHSVVFATMKKNNLIDFIPDARSEVDIPTYLGHRVIVDDGMTNAGGVYDNWLFGTGAILKGVGTPDVPAETERVAAAGDGGGQDTLHSRISWSMHPDGHAWAGATTAGGGPTNAVIDDAASWSRRWVERKQVPIARLITRES